MVEKNIKKLAHRGVSCMRVTKELNYPNNIIIIGANQSDSCVYKGKPCFNLLLPPPI